ncbi:hypothetical protein D8Y16_13070 [Listeria seeligeri]|uniref:immunoglobulin-like domain-containing protein n=1 Tax=Listeria seeligeri TaxID=1640 RepID=UPI0019413D0C|nr:immunoglobulin-like domain-containing protein [Listeria seeligeri]MBM5598049.1 hypothetical protein [Listeria seeligeri]
MKKQLYKQLKKILVVATIICSVIITFSTNLMQVNAELANGDEYNSAIKKLTEQVLNEDHTPLSEKVTWKFKWIIFTDVTFNQEGVAPEHKTLTKDDELYSKVIEEDFKQTLEEANPNINVEIDLEFYRTPIQVDTSNNDFILHESQIATILEERVEYGAYDSIFVFSESPGGGGATKANYYSDITRGAGYCSIGFSNRYTNNYPEHSTNRTVEYSAEIALHEFCHQMEMAGLIDTYPNVHGSTSYGYENDPQAGWTQFYLDFLTGKVKDPNTGKLIGVYPEMWRLTPRYLKEITPQVRGCTWYFKPNQLPNQSLDGIEKLYIPIDYKNAYGSPWFDLAFKYGSENIDPSKIQSSNTNVAQVLNFDGGIARTKVVGAGETELTFTTKENDFVYKKKVSIYDEPATNVAVNGLFEDDDVLNSIKDSTTQKSIDDAQKLVDLLPSNLATDYQEAISKAQRELDDKVKISPLTLPIVYVDTKEIAIQGMPGAQITLVLPNGTQTTKTANSNGEASFNLNGLKEGDKIEAFQTFNGVKGEVVTTIVQAVELLNAPLVNHYDMSSAYVSGTVSEGTKRIALVVNGSIVRYGEIASNGTYKIYAGDVLLTSGQNFTVVPFNVDRVSGLTTEAVVHDGRVEAPEVNNYFVGTAYLSGTVSEGTNRIALVVNGNIVRYGEVSKDGTYKIYASDVLQVAGQEFTVLPVNEAGIKGHPASGTVKESKVEKPTVNNYYASTAYITGNVSEGTKRIALVVNGNIIRYGEIASNGTYKLYAGDILLTSGQEFTVVPVNEAGIKGHPASGTVKESKVEKPTVNNYYASTAYITGNVSEGTKRIALVVNGNIIRYGEIASNGTYKLYAGDILLTSGQEFTVMPVNKDGVNGFTTTGTVF